MHEPVVGHSHSHHHIRHCFKELDGCSCTDLFLGPLFSPIGLHVQCHAAFVTVALQVVLQTVCICGGSGRCLPSFAPSTIVRHCLISLLHYWGSLFLLYF